MFLIAWPPGSQTMPLWSLSVVSLSDFPTLEAKCPLNPALGVLVPPVVVAFSKVLFFLVFSLLPNLCMSSFTSSLGVWYTLGRPPSAPFRQVHKLCCILGRPPSVSYRHEPKLHFLHKASCIGLFNATMLILHSSLFHGFFFFE